MVEDHALTGQAVDVRRLDDPIAHASERVPPLIVGEEKDDIRPLGRLGRGLARDAQKDRQGRDGGKDQPTMKLHEKILGARAMVPPFTRIRENHRDATASKRCCTIHAASPRPGMVDPQDRRVRRFTPFRRLSRPIPGRQQQSTCQGAIGRALGLPGASLADGLARFPGFFVANQGKRASLAPCRSSGVPRLRPRILRYATYPNGVQTLPWLWPGG